ncbi:MAG: TIGR01457 family HAD-type hydrolase [Chloroflexi bacterium]|nr:TIGR01457 family HAD-type hydrolase [Chloroflexota bacterium]
MLQNLAHLRALLIDLDGVVYRGSEVLPGAKEFFDFLSARNLAFCLLTNNSTATPAQYVCRLACVGITVNESAVLTSGEAAAQYLQKRGPSSAGVYVIGEEGLRQPIARAGFRFDGVAPDYVVVGLDREFTYDKMAVACLAIRNGARLIASNPDTTFPTERGLLPGAGAILASITASTGKRPVVVGKPNTRMLTLAMERLGVGREETAIVGDRLDTDVLAGRRAGITTILVLTGVTTPSDLARSRLQPDWVSPDLTHLRSALEG